MTTPLAAATAAQASDINLRQGAITGLNTIAGTATVQVQGGDVSANVGWIQGYNPVIGDNVLIAVNGQSWTILGATAAKPGVGVGMRMIMFAQRSAAKSGITAEVGVVRGVCQVKAFHRYYITSTGLSVGSTVNEVMQWQALIRGTTDGTIPIAGSSPNFGLWIGDTDAGNGGGAGTPDGMYAPPQDQTLNLLLCARRIVGTGTLAISSADGAGPRIVVYDTGISLPNTGIDV